MTNRIGRYEIQAELGRGGFGQVFRAYDPTVGRLVAIKTLTVGDDQELIKRFRNEAAAAGKLRHTNIVIIYDFGEHNGSPYLVMELLDGDDLERIIASRRSLTLLQRLNIISQAASGLHHAHANGVVHRDIKPANIMLQRDGVVKIMDFGIALLNQATAARLTPQGSLLGTFPYMAPEQFHGTASDVLTDVFAFGVTCYKLLTGVHPFHAEEMGGLMYNIVNKIPEPIRALTPECPEALEQAVFRMLAKERSLRYQSLEDVRFDIEPVIAELRKERVNDLILEARALKESEEFESAQALVRQALDTDPGNRTARELREALQREIREHQIRPRIAALVTAGREDQDARRFDAAMQKFVSALQLDNSNPEIHALIAECRAARERAERAARLLENAQQALTGGNLTSAHGIVLNALSTDPRNLQAEALKTSIEQHIEARERERRLQEGLGHARRLMVLENFDKAIEGLEALAQEHAGSAALRDLLTRARAEQDGQLRRRRLQAATEEAKALVKNGSFGEAVERLSQWQVEFPESTELRDLAAFAAEELQAEKQAAAVSKATVEARALVESLRFEQAVEVVRGALAEYPGAAALRELMQSVTSARISHQRRVALDEALAEAEAFNREQRFREASERIAAYVRAYGETSELEALRHTAEEGLENQRRQSAIRKLTAEARSLLDADRPDSATKVLQMGTVQFPEHPDLVRLLGEARNLLEEQRQAEAISRIISEAESLARAKHFDRALEVLDKGLSDYGNNERLVRCRQATLATEARYTSEHAQRAAVDRARQLRASGKLQEAFSEIDAALRDHGSGPALLDLRQRLEGELAERERAAEIRSIEAEAQTLLDRGHFASATQILQAAQERFPGDDRLAKLKEVAQTRVREEERAGEVARIVREAHANAGSGHFEAALKLLDAGLLKYVNDADLMQARSKVQGARTEHDRRLALEGCKTRARSLHAEGRLTEALEVLVSGLKTFGDEAELRALKDRVEADQEIRREEEAVRNLAARAESLLTRDRAPEAVSLLRASPEYATRPSIAEILRRAGDRVAEQQREQEVAAKEREIRSLVEIGDFAGGLDALERALKQHPGSDRLGRLRAPIESARKRADLQAAAVHALKSGELGQALDAVRQALQSFPSDREFQQLETRIVAEQDRRERLAAIDKSVAEASAHLAKGDPGAAATLLRPLRLKYAGEPRLTELLDQAEEQLRRAEREQQISSVREEAEALLEQRNYDGAINLLNGRFPGEPRFQPLLARAHEQLDAQRRHQAREQARGHLVALEQRIDGTRRSRLNALRAEARQAVAAHSEDAELNAIADRIDRHVEALLAAPAAPKKPLPWIWIGIAAGVIAVVATGAFLLPRLTSGSNVAKTLAPATFPVEIRTDPPGATVSVGDRTCTPPNCRFDLPVGRYPVTARLPGYQPAEREIAVESGNLPGATTLTLNPEPPPPPPAGSHQGTLLLRTGVAGVRVSIDQIPRGLTDARGELRSELEAGSHAVRVEKAGYRTPPEQRVLIADNKSEPLTFTLSPLPSRLEVRGAPTGAEVTVGTGPSRRSDGSSVLSMEVPPGNQVLNVTEGKANRQVAGTFEPGATLIMDWKDIAPPKMPAPPPPKAVSAEDKQKQAWEQVRNSTDPEQVALFLRDNPQSPWTRDAQSRFDELLWGRTNQSDGNSLQAYVSRLPHGAHAPDALRLMDDIKWNAVNKTNAQLLQAFIDANGSSRHRAEAQTILDRLNRERQEAENRRKQVEQAASKEGAAIRAALQQFNNAFVHKSARELKQIWPAADRDWLESVNQRGAYFVATLYAMGEPEVTGDRATIRCELTTQTIIRGQPQPQNRKIIKVTLRKTGEQWLIEDPRGQE